MHAMVNDQPVVAKVGSPWRFCEVYYYGAMKHIFDAMDDLIKGSQSCRSTSGK